jgi:hypothetical protein
MRKLLFSIVVAFVFLSGWLVYHPARAATSVITGPPGWTQLAQSVASGSASITFTSITQAYTDVMLVAGDILPSTSSTLSCTFSANGVAFTPTGFSVGNNGAFSTTQYGGFIVPAYSKSGNLGLVGLNTPQTGAMVAPALAKAVGVNTDVSGYIKIAGPLTTILCTPSAGTITSGTFTLYGR